LILFCQNAHPLLVPERVVHLPRRPRRVCSSLRVGHHPGSRGGPERPGWRRPRRGGAHRLAAPASSPGEGRCGRRAFPSSRRMAASTVLGNPVQLPSAEGLGYLRVQRHHSAAAVFGDGDLVDVMDAGTPWNRPDALQESRAVPSPGGDDGPAPLRNDSHRMAAAPHNPTAPSKPGQVEACPASSPADHGQGMTLDLQVAGRSSMASEWTLSPRKRTKRPGAT